MAHWREVLPADRFIEVDYEELVADPEATRGGCRVLRPGLGRRLPAPGATTGARVPPPACGRRASRSTARSVERWRRYEPWLGELRELMPPQA